MKAANYHTAFLFLFWTVLFSSPAAWAVTSNVGATPGNFAVAPSGAATYTIPITVPPGVSGMQPSIALTYDSRGGNGPLGVGWNLTGLSAIHRCAATIDTDGYKGGINLDGNDRFCLHGQRLVAVSGAYGANGTEYRTERETFTKVISYGAQGSGPAYFKAWTKGGQVLEYGFTSDARLAVSTSATVITWSVNKIQDAVGNYLSVTYFTSAPNNNSNNPIDGIAYNPSRIDYTGNTAAGLVTSRAVIFQYEERWDQSPSHVGGIGIYNRWRLSHVVTQANGQTVRDYQLSYDSAGAAGATRLTRVTECGSDGVCLSPTTFNWNSPGNGTFSTVSLAVGTINRDYATLVRGDFNGDGKTDFIRQDNTAWGGGAAVFLSRGGGAFTTVNLAAGAFNRDNTTLIPGDFDGDGKTDFIRQDNTAWGGGAAVFLSRGEGGFATVNLAAGAFNRDFATLIPGDFDGDGRADFIRQDNTAWGGGATVFLSRGAGAFATVSLAAGAFNRDNTSLTPGDFNGDGRTDFIRQDNAAWGGGGAVFLSRGAGVFAIVNLAAGVNRDKYTLITGDFNGDGKTDFIRQDVEGWGVPLLSKGDGTFVIINTGLDTGTISRDSTSLIPGDFNGDGRTDFIRQSDTTRGGGATVFLSTYLDAKGFTQVELAAGPYNRDHATLITGDFNGDGRTDFITQTDASLGGGGALAMGTPTNTATDVIAGITTGLSTQITNITYKPLTDASVYTTGPSYTQDQYPVVMDLQAPIYVVASYQASDGLGGLNTTSYRYGGAKMHLTGRGYLGFETVTQTAPNGIRTTTTYAQTTCDPYDSHNGPPDMRCIGLPLFVGVWQPAPSNQRLSYIATTWDTVGTYPYAKTRTEASYELNGALVASVTTTTNPPDANGNFTYARVVTNDNYITETTNTYLAADTTRWLLTRLSTSTVTRSLPTGETLTRKSAHQYNVNGLLAKEVVEPATADASGNYTAGPYTLVTAYTYDLYGHRNKTTISGTGITARSSMLDYLTSPGDAAPQIKNTNAKGHTEIQTFDARYGVMTSLTGPNGRTTTWSFDGFGRKTQENRSDGTFTLTDYAWCPSVACPLGAPGYVKYAVTTTNGNATSNLAPATVFYDMFGRELRRKTIGYGATADILQDTGYDALGRMVRTTAPYFQGSASPSTTVIPDLLGRPSTVTAANGLVTIYGYAGLTTTVTNTHSEIPGGTQKTTRVKNSQGLLTSVTNTLGQITRYTYDPFDNLRQTIDPNSNIVQMDYDIRGRKIAMTDPDMGYWTYNYNVLGELTSRTDAKNQVVIMVYDVLGRMTKRTEPEGVSTWVYDPATAKGELSSVSGPATTGPNSYKQTYTYDSLGRLTRISSAIAGTTYLMDTTYDTYSRVASVTYPTAYQAKRLTVYNSYDAQGYLRTVSNVPGSTPATWYWKANSMDALGHITSESLGNGLTTAREYYSDSGLPSRYTTSNNVQATLFTFDILGSLSVRTEYYPGYYYEAYDYDDLNRLTSITYGPVNKTYTYDVLGNIKSKSDYGDYRYAEPVAAPNVPAGPHAVTSVYKAGALVANYRYDLNGNMISGPGRSISYTSFNLPSQITQGAVTDSFVYDAGHQRILQKSNNGDTTVYLNPRWDTGFHFEKVIHLNAAAEYLHYIYAGSTPIAIYTVKGNGDSDIKYLHKDHLGSIVATTNANGAVIERMSYDAFGKRRQPNGQDGAVTSTSTHHGYTGHEHHDDVGLINMNGRFYDPLLGRFAEADRIVQNPADMQTLNRYSYVGNNPLSRVDPSGHAFCTNFEGSSTYSPNGCTGSGGFGPNGASGNTQNNTNTNNGNTSSSGGSTGGSVIIPMGNGTMTVNITNNAEPGAVYYQGPKQGYEIVSGAITSFTFESSLDTARCNLNGCHVTPEIGPNTAIPDFWRDFSAYTLAQFNYHNSLLERSARGDERASQELIQAIIMSYGGLGAITEKAVAKAAQETAKVGELIATHGKTMSNKELDKLTKNIRAEGVKEPLTVTEHEGKLYILDGHHRALAAPRAGISEVPINRIELPFGAYKTPADLIFTPGGY